MEIKSSEQAPLPYFPESALGECPEKLQTINITQDQWNALDDEQQRAVLERQSQSWATEYHKCAITHNIGVREYKISLEKRQKFLEQNNEEE